VSGSEIDDTVIDVLRNIASGSRFSILLGAGASAGAGLPDWDTLSRELLVRSGAIDDEDTAAAFLAAQDPALAAEAARIAAGSGWESTLAGALYDGAPTDLRPGALHLATANLALAHPPGNVQLFTLNFDLLIEHALELVADEIGKPISFFTRTSGSPRAESNSFEIHHLHGAVDPVSRTAKDVILTLSEFNTLVADKHPWQVSALHEALQRGPLILAGTSYRDPDIRAWLSQLDLATKSNVVVFLARQGLGLNRAQFSSVQDALTEQWEAIGVKPVITQDHADAAQALIELPHIAAAGYKTPRERTQDLWQLCVREFDVLQEQHSSTLETDAEAVKAATGGPANLVLWLSNGAGQVVRWSAPDRIYKNAHALRTVPTGHDSPWIVGKCLGSNELLGENLRELSDDIRRWRYVLAIPVVVERPGGPPFTFGAITAALPQEPDQAEIDVWVAALEPIVEAWSGRLSSL
jgi:hypothetical protein